MRCDACVIQFSQLSSFINHVIECASWEDNAIDVMKCLTEVSKDELVRSKLTTSAKGDLKQTKSADLSFCFCGESLSSQVDYRAHIQGCLAKFASSSAESPCVATNDSVPADKVAPSSTLDQNCPSSTEPLEPGGESASETRVEEIAGAETSGFEKENSIDERPREEQEAEPDSRFESRDDIPIGSEKESIVSMVQLPSADFQVAEEVEVVQLQHEIVAQPDGTVIASEIEIGTWDGTVEDEHRYASNDCHESEATDSSSEIDQKEVESKGKKTSNKRRVPVPYEYVGKKVTLDLPQTFVKCDCGLMVPNDRLTLHLKSCPTLSQEGDEPEIFENLFSGPIKYIDCICKSKVPAEQMSEHLKTCVGGRLRDVDGAVESPKTSRGNAKSPRGKAKSPSAPVLLTCVCKKKYPKTSIKEHLLTCETWKVVKEKKNSTSPGSQNEPKGGSSLTEEENEEEKEWAKSTDSGRFYFCECKARFTTSNVFKIHLKTCTKSNSPKFEDPPAFQRENVMLSLDPLAQGEVLTDRTCECGFRIESLCQYRQHSASCPKASKFAKKDSKTKSPAKLRKVSQETILKGKTPRTRRGRSESSDGDDEVRIHKRSSKPKPAKKRKAT